MDPKHDVVVAGFVRNNVGCTTHSIPQVILDLCGEYVFPIKYQDEGEDPLNLITHQDMQMSDSYKLKGNEFFKSQDYHSAIIKYTTALRFNPNNFLVYSNRAYCHYLLTNYTEALQDIQQCVRLKPTFLKGWYRYALILQKLHKYGRAAIALRTAYHLSVDWNEHGNQANQANQFQTMYENLMQRLQREQNTQAMKYIDGFDCQPEHWSSAFNTAAAQCPRIGEIVALMRNNKEDLTEEVLQEFEELMQSDTCLALSQEKEEQEFYAYVQQSKCEYLAKRNAFQFDEPHNRVGNERWIISWSSTPQIDHNKRIFCVNVFTASELLLSNWMQHAVPNAAQTIEILLRAMTYCNMSVTHQSGIKPRSILIAYRMRDGFDKIEQCMRKFGVRCVLESKADSEKACRSEGTNVNGWNHLENGANDIVNQ
mmetsp:Transcript_14149/g.22082  ORF Transcript_14149/g.22082 Transcript_14149/m.22082 type:complete len:425 (-) Transcript_14149:101-1375(-)